MSLCIDTEKPFEPFTVRIYFEWFEGEGEKQDDAADTVIGMNAAQAKVEQVNNTEGNENTEVVETEEETNEETEEVEVGKLKIKATISFKQLLESEIKKDEPATE